MPYRSPELFDPPLGLTLDARTDIWSAGCLLFAWWYGYSPFECEFNCSANAQPLARNSNSNSNSNNSNSNSNDRNIELRSYEKISDDGQSGKGQGQGQGQGQDGRFLWGHGQCGERYASIAQQPYPMKVVQCSHLRILASPPVRPNREVVADPSSAVVDDLVAMMVVGELSERPFIGDVVAATRASVANVTSDSEV